MRTQVYDIDCGVFGIHTLDVEIHKLPKFAATDSSPEEQGGWVLLRAFINDVEVTGLLPEGGEAEILKQLEDV